MVGIDPDLLRDDGEAVTSALTQSPHEPLTETSSITLVSSSTLTIGSPSYRRISVMEPTDQLQPPRSGAEWMEAMWDPPQK